MENYTIKYNHIVMNTMKLIQKKEERRIIDDIDIKNYEQLLFEKFQERGLQVSYEEDDCCDSKVLFRCSYQDNDQNKKKIFKHFFLEENRNSTEELLQYVCPYQPSQDDERRYYIMLPWLRKEDLPSLEDDIELPLYDVFMDSSQFLLNDIEKRSSKDLEKLLSYEKKVAGFFEELVQEQIAYYEKKTETAVKRLSKIRSYR